MVSYSPGTKNSTKTSSPSAVVLAVVPLPVVLVEQIAGSQTTRRFVEVHGCLAAENVLEVLRANVVVILADGARGEGHQFADQRPGSKQPVGRDVDARALVVLGLQHRLQPEVDALNYREAGCRPGIKLDGVRHLEKDQFRALGGTEPAGKGVGEEQELRLAENPILAVSPHPDGPNEHLCPRHTLARQLEVHRTSPVNRQHIEPALRSGDIVFVD